VRGVGGSVVSGGGGKGKMFFFRGGGGGGGLGVLLRSEGLGEVWQRESLTNLHPMRLASRPFTPATHWRQ